MHLVSAASLLLVALLGSQAAKADSAHFDLKLDAPAGCPSTAEIVAAVTSLVRTAPAEPLHVSAQIVREGQQFTLSANWESGQRRLRGDSCEGVSRALIAIIALAIDPTVELNSVAFPEASAASNSAAEPALASDPTRAEPLPVRPREAVPAPRDNAKRTVPAPDTNRAELELGASLLGLGEWGALPTPSYGITGVVRGSVRPWSAELGGSWLSPQWAEVASNADKGGDVSWRTLLANICRAVAGPASACAGVELGELGGKGGSEVAQSDSGTSLWLAPTLTALARLPLAGGAAAELRAVGAFPLFRPEFSIEPYPPLHRPSWASGRVSLGIAFR